MNKKVSFLRIIILLVTSSIFSSQLCAQEAEVPLGSSDVETENASSAAVGQSLQDNSVETPSASANAEGGDASSAIVGETLQDNSTEVSADRDPDSLDVLPDGASTVGPEEEANFFVEFYRGVKTLLVLGGPVVWILLVVSILGLTLAFTKFLQFSRTNNVAIKVIDDAIGLWLEGNTAKSSGNLERSAIPIALDIKYGLEMREVLDQGSLEDELIRRSSSFLRGYAHNLKPLELIYYLAPVMGLLGTVLGMIDAFRGLASSAGAAGESSALASGIWEALLTTAVGLSIAIPFAVMHALLETKLDTLTDQVGDMVTRVCSRNEVT